MHRARIVDSEGALIAELVGHTERILRATWNPVAPSIVTASDDGRAIIWDLRGKPLKFLPHAQSVYDADWDPAGQRVATASGFSGTPAIGHFSVWTASGERLFDRETHLGAMSSVRWSPDGTRLATSNQDKKIRVWTAQGELIATLRHGYWSTVLSWSTDGTARLLTHDLDRARIWSMNGESLSSIYGLGQRSFPGQAQWSPGRPELLLTSEDGTAAIWSTESRFSTKVSHPEKVTSAHWSPDRERIVTTSEDRSARIWSATGRLLATLAHGDVVNEAAWSPDGAHLATAAADATVGPWTRDGRHVSALKGHSRAVVQASWNSDGSRLLTSSGDFAGSGYLGEAILWSASGERLATVHANGTGVLSAAWHPSGSFFVTIDADLASGPVRSGRAYFWSADGKQIAELVGHSDGAWGCRWSPDGELLLTASYDHTARIWDKTGRPLHVLKHDWVVSEGSWSPDSMRLATLSWTEGAEMREVRVWRRDGSLEHVFRDADGKSNSVSWSPAGEHLVTTSDDGTARIRKPDGEVLAVVLAHTAPARISEWSPDGSLILTFSDDGTAAVWPSSQEGILKVVDGRIRREFTRDERTRYGRE